MSATLTITDEDLGWDDLRWSLKLLGKTRIESGLFGPKQAQKGHWLEFGSEHAGGGTVEPRPWLSAAADTNAQRFASAMGQAIGEVADRRKLPHDAMIPVGEMMADAAAAVIHAGEVGGPALADSTVDAKGHGIKGLDTGKMIGAIQSRVKP